MAGTEAAIGPGRLDKTETPGDCPGGRDRIGVVGTVKAPLADTIRWVHYHKNLGVEQIFLFLDDPADPAAGALSGLDGVACFRCDDDYWAGQGLATRPRYVCSRQGHNADLAVRLAGEMGLDWIIHIDSDELLRAEGGLGTALSAVPGGVDVAGFRVLEAVPEAIEYECPFTGMTLFRDWPRAARHRARIARAMGCRRAFLDGKYFRGHQLKSAVRIGTPMTGMGNHTPYPLEGRPFTFAWAHDIELLHYDCRGFEEWLRKWIPRIEGIVKNYDESSRILQSELLERALAESRERTIEVYKQIHFLDGYERAVLFALGLLRRVRLPPAHFEAPAAGRSRGGRSPGAPT